LIIPEASIAISKNSLLKILRLFQTVCAALERDKARIEAEKARQINAFVEKMLSFRG
jgi:hypothetical protein